VSEKRYNAPMFLHREHDDTGPFAISQASHAWLAWQLAMHWGNRRFARAAPRAEVLAAVLLHDSGWVEFDSSPTVDDGGRPRTFDRMEVDTHLEIWRDCVRRAGLHARYAGLLVASHFAGLAERKTQDLLDRGDTNSARAVQVFRAEMERLQAGWEEQLATDARYEGCLRGPGRAINAQIVESVDRISVHLCANLGSPFRADGLSPNGDTLPIEFEIIDGTTWRVSPWPLEGDRLRLQVEARRLPRARFEDDAELREALHRARVSRLSFQLLRPSAS
jgi:hypothetical protein